MAGRRTRRRARPPATAWSRPMTAADPTRPSCRHPCHVRAFRRDGSSICICSGLSRAGPGACTDNVRRLTTARPRGPVTARRRSRHVGCRHVEPRQHKRTGESQGQARRPGNCQPPQDPHPSSTPVEGRRSRRTARPRPSPSRTAADPAAAPVRDGLLRGRRSRQLSMCRRRSQTDSATDSHAIEHAAAVCEASARRWRGGWTREPGGRRVGKSVQVCRRPPADRTACPRCCWCGASQHLGRHWRTTSRWPTKAMGHQESGVAEQQQFRHSDDVRTTRLPPASRDRQEAGVPDYYPTAIVPGRR
jgi:hypothetical protein